MSRAERLVALWLSFPALADHAMDTNGEPLKASIDNLAALDEYATKYAGQGGRAAAAFVLAAWTNARAWRVGPFNMFDAFRVWDEANRAAFLAYCKDPF